MSNLSEIVGIILIVCGIIYTFLRGMGKLPVTDIDEFENKFLKIKGGPGLILIALGIILFLSGSSWYIPGQTFPTPASTPTFTIPAQNISSPDCFQEIPENRTKTIEVGRKDFHLIGELESKDEPIVIKFTDNNKPIGYIKLLFNLNSQLFTIEKIVEVKCQQIEDYTNIDTGNKNKLQNWDTVQIRFAASKYDLRLGYDGGIIYASFTQTV